MADFGDGIQLLKKLEGALPAATSTALGTCIDLAEARQLSLFLIGGVVRDLVLSRSHIDLDIAVEGDPASLADELAQQLGGRAVHHPRFGTATVSSPEFHVDLAQTRRESYARPGALPQVQAARLLDDLGRRDFSINTVALRLTEPKGEIIDPYSGLDDLHYGVLRVLHDDSFKDDATRVLRGIRYASRLEFRFEEHTEQCLERDTSYLGTITGPRLRRELALQFHEPRAAAGALMAQNYGVLRAISADLGLDQSTANRWQGALAGPGHAPLDELGFCLLAAASSAAGIDAISQRLHLSGRVERALIAFVRLRDLFAKLVGAREDAVAVAGLLDRFPAAAIWALSLVDDDATSEACTSYLSVWQQVKPRLRGNDLLALGVAPGEAIGEALKLLRRARLEGRTHSRDDEIELIKTKWTP